MTEQTYGGSFGLIETREDVGTDDGGVVAFWLQQLKLAEREDRQFIHRGRAIVRRYRAERSRSVTQTRRPVRFNILWSNVETLKPILYGRTPKPDVQRRHKNNDAVARLGAEILERALSYEDDLDEFDCDSVGPLDHGRPQAAPRVDLLKEPYPFALQSRHCGRKIRCADRPVVNDLS